MSKIQSSTTITITAYLTSEGRKIFLPGTQNRFVRKNDSNDIIDRFKITDFSLYDSDVNYNAISPLASGDVPSLSGKKNNVNQTLINNKRLYY